MYRLSDLEQPHGKTKQERYRFDRRVPATWVAQRINDEPFPDSSTVFVPGVENGIETKLSNSNNLPRSKNGVTATTDSTVQKKQAVRYITQQRLSAAMVAQAKTASPTGEAIYWKHESWISWRNRIMPPDPCPQDDAVNRVNAVDWGASMAEQSASPIKNKNIRGGRRTLRY